MDTESTKHPNWTVSEDWVGIKHYKIKGNDKSARSNQIKDVGRGAQLTQYREGSNLQVAAKEKNAMLGMLSGDDCVLRGSA